VDSNFNGDEYLTSKSIKDNLQKWSSKTNLVMAVLGVLYLAVYSLEVVFSSHDALVDQLEVISNVIWVIFALDVAFRLVSAESALDFLKTSWLELLALAIPFMRILRVFRVVVAVRGLRPFLKSRLAATGTYVLLLLPLTWFTGGVAVLDAENSGAGASITNLPDALWWSLATITTVGYGDLYPKTFEGKFVAAALMIMGIALVSVSAGMFGSWIMGDKRDSK
jgi:voltage-gated potassium channel